MLCDNTTSASRIHLYGNYSPASEFYVFVGVTAFLYCLGILLFYVFGEDKYRNVEMIPIVVSTFGHVCGAMINVKHRSCLELPVLLCLRGMVNVWCISYK